MVSEKRVCFENEDFVLLLDDLRDTFGSAGESMIFHMSNQYGKYLMQSAKKIKHR